jgi:carbon monoxide dehydrogenase subunit G
MTGHRIDLERHVQAPVERVWEVLTDLAQAEQTLSGVEKVEPLTEGPYRVGTRWRETRRMFGKEATEEMQVTAVEAPTRTVLEADSSGVHYVTEFTLTPSTAGATRLAMSFTAAQGQATFLHRALWSLFGGLGAKATGKVMAQDLQDIAARAEQR